ncbi:MAG: PAS domain S-box protein [Candidatus Bathyarchaeota archaeon]|nr:PAS domain S-box protein [Candidatus Bathyarchaeota archaeon]
MAYDVTERRKTENALRESEERFRKAFQVSPAAMAISTVDEGKFIDVNESFLLISGYAREELIGHRSVDVGVIGPDERAKVMEFIRRQGYVRNHEFPAVTRPGDASPCSPRPTSSTWVERTTSSRP